MDTRGSDQTAEVFLLLDKVAIVVEQLRKIYRPGRRQEVKAVDGVSLEVRQGEIFGLLGPNGAGKTTLLKVLTTLTLPTAGRAAVMGHDVVKEALEVRQAIAVVLQEYAVELYLSVWDNLITFGKFHGLSLAESRRRAEKVLAQFHLEEYASQKAQDLSGGTRRRLQVSKMFLVETPVLFLDEPTIGMDPFVKRELLATIKEQARAGRTVFLTTQMLSEAEELCDRVLILDRGKVAAEGDLASLKLMSRGLYDVVASFESVGEELLSCLRRANPLRLEVKRNTVEMTLRCPEREVLTLLSAVAERWLILHFEVSGASLEDVFLEILGKPPRPESPMRNSAS
ncbi:MAG: ABC transporter ATP-binding protein [Acidobacteria bacterium]|nr:ABC transporter ATP-binding protein [Acidobacteriota bacterium]